MHLVLCLDQQNGLLFGGRRQSSDRYLRKDLLSYVGGNVLWMDTYSAGQFLEDKSNIRVSDGYATEAAEEDYCFAERGAAQLLEKASTLTVYRWDKVYPADVRLDAGMLSNFIIAEKTEIEGYSHDRIVREVYICEK